MAQDRPKRKFESSDTTVAVLLKKAKVLKAPAKDATVDGVVRHFAADSLKIGRTTDILDGLVSKAITKLQKTDQAMQTVDPDSKDALLKQEQEYENQRKLSLEKLKEAQLISEKEQTEYVERLQKSPIPEEYKRSFPQPITAIDQRSEQFRQQAENLLTGVENTQEKIEDRYTILFAKIHGRNPAPIETTRIRTISGSDQKKPGL